VSQRVFTAEQANDALLEIRPLAERLVEHRADLLVATARLAELSAGFAGNGGRIDPAQRSAFAEAAEAAEEGIRTTVEALERAGVVVKDLDAGLIDFPAERDGRPVFLCWQLGEDEVRFWHGLEEGFAGRKSLRESE
jgi:hypothetical protein